MVALSKLFRIGPLKRHRFESLLRPHIEPLFRIAYRYTQCQADAEGLVQDVLARLAFRMDEMEAQTTLRPWLVQNLLQCHAERYRHQQETPAEIEQWMVRCDDACLSDRINRFGNPADAHAQPDVQRALLAALTDLEQAQQDVLLLHDLEGLSKHEIVQILQIDLDSVESQLQRARVRLQQVLDYS